MDALVDYLPVETQSMEARLSRAALIVAAAFALGASHRTTNFIVTASSKQFAQQVGVAAEQYRHDLAIEWLGTTLPRWPQPCPITIDVGPNLGAGGATSFMFQQGQPFGWQMSVQGTAERILDSVLPHEVTHTIFATHFGRPLPRWADEGACTTVEHRSERQRQQDMLVEFLTTDRGIPFNSMFAMTEYPPDVLPLYAQGYSLARYLIAQGGKPKFTKYVGDGMRSGNWPEATRRHYGHQDLSDLQVTWLSWVREGSPLQPESGQLAANSPARGDRPAAEVALASAQSAGTRSRLAEGRIAQPEAAIRLVPVPPAGQSLAAVNASAGQPRGNPKGNMMLALATGAPPQAANAATRSTAAVDSRVNQPDSRVNQPASWYARQRDSATTSGARAASEPRVASVTPSAFSPGSTSPLSMSRPQAAQQMQPQVLQWDPSPLAAPWQPRAIGSAGEPQPGTRLHDAPLSSGGALQAGGTVWR